jgi:hypothetical protein
MLGRNELGFCAVCENVELDFLMQNSGSGTEWLRE